MDYIAAGVGHFQNVVLVKVDPVRKFGFCTKKRTILVKIWASKMETSLSSLLKIVFVGAGFLVFLPGQFRSFLLGEDQLCQRTAYFFL